MHYVELVKQLRRRNGLTQQQVADFLHIDRSTYAYYESGRTKISVESLLHLARLYQISLGEMVGESTPVNVLMDDTDYSTSLIDDSIVRFAQLSREEQYLVILYRSGTDEQRRELLSQANELTAPEEDE
ncbi:MAG: helix-turn-helix domain-containing protein [Oscillospiraceae bacterium]|nr:helix-turn-helix domain-containing protein [Oscillospiraceae bacterium]